MANTGLMSAIFQGSPSDIYIHWLILSLGIMVFASGMLVLFSCRAVTGMLNLYKTDNSAVSRFYRAYYKYHSTYWSVFWFALTLHLLTAFFHLGLPVNGVPYSFFQQGSFYTSIGNFVLLGVVLSSCRSVVNLFKVFLPKSPLEYPGYQKFYKYHSILWWLLGIFVASHIIFGVIHAVNT